MIVFEGENQSETERRAVAQIIFTIIFVVAFIITNIIIATNIPPEQEEEGAVEVVTKVESHSKKVVLNEENMVFYTLKHEIYRKYDETPKKDVAVEDDTPKVSLPPEGMRPMGMSDDEIKKFPHPKEEAPLCYTKADAVDIAKALYSECRGVPSITEQACVVWTVLNRVDNRGSSIYYELRKPNQFAFSENTRVDEALLTLAYDVLDRWHREKQGEEDVGRVLPPHYMYFHGKGGHNHFKDGLRSGYTVWNYSLPSPYAN